MDWAEKAAGTGSVGALKLLAWCYGEGKGVKVDPYGVEEQVLGWGGSLGACAAHEGCA